MFCRVICWIFHYIPKSSVIFVRTSLTSLNCLRYFVSANRLRSLLLPVYSMTGTPLEYWIRWRQVELEITMMSLRSLPVPKRMFKSNMCRSKSRSKYRCSLFIKKSKYASSFYRVAATSCKYLALWKLKRISSKSFFLSSDSISFKYGR